MQSSFLRGLSVFALAVTAVFVLRAHDAQAGWPPAPGADMTDKSNWPNDFNQQWNYLSYFPARNATAGPLTPQDQVLGAAGMSVDKAWTYTVGRDDVKIFVIDCGIKWDEPDLVNKVALNLAELAKFKPQTALAAACGGTGPLAGYDCNGDGIFTVADYRDDPRISPVVTGEKCYPNADPTQAPQDRIKGDVNRNCILDPGDLIEMFSDGVDDDANGYTDDIAGWDFYKNDNNPYDDTRYGHGTGEAKDSNAEGNNGVESLGVCPLCRFVPLRVGDSFITESNEFGKAVIYATDNGAKVVQEALGTLDLTAFAKAAIDYAYSKGATVVASMADENSFHHNLPGTANHTLTVHTVRYDQQKIEDSTTFISYDECSNYGGQLSMSISGTSCSSEATGRSSGMAGLTYSMAAQEGLTLSAEEVIQLFKMNADDIDVPTSRDPDPVVYWSQPGWDQRFGYGRANAARMMQAIKDRLIPPEVDILSPEWFTPVHSDRVSGPIAIMGRVAAARAKSYDFKVQWAAGVQPMEADYKDLVPPLTNIPGTTPSGGTVPLGQFDPQQIDTTHVQDNDSLLGENDRTISIRVQAVAHYDNGDVKGEARRVVSVTNEKNGLDKDLLPGFPIALGTSLEASAKLADIDGDGVRDIVQPDSAGRLHVYTLKNGTPTELPGFPYLTRVIDGLNPNLTSEPTVPSYLSAPAYKAGAQGGVDPQMAREGMIQAAAIADVDGDGRPEIIFATWDGTIYVIDSTGKDLPNWPQRLPLVPSCPQDPTKTAEATCMDISHRFARGTHSAPVIVDMNKDGKPEIVLGAFDGNLYVFKLDGTILDGWPVALEMKGTTSPGPGRIMATPTVVDLNGDGIPEVISGSNQQIGGGGSAGPVFVVDGRGMATPGGPYLNHWPIVVTSPNVFPVVAEGIVASQAVADFDNDGVPDILVQGNVARPLILPKDPGAQPNIAFEPPNRLPPLNGDGEPGLQATSEFGANSPAFQPDVMFPLFSEPAIGDLDQDGTPDVISSGGSLTLLGALAGGGIRAPRAQHLLAFWSGKTGSMLPGSPVLMEDFTFLNNHVIADVSGDAYPEVITGSAGYFLHAANACGVEAPGFPRFTGGWIASTATVGDIDGDQGLEVTAATRDGYLFAWKTLGKTSGPIEWESYHHDNANTGNYATALTQGTKQLAATPIDCTPPAAPTQDQFDAGGCGCKTAGASSRDSRAALLGAALAVALILARRRTRRMTGRSAVNDGVRASMDLPIGSVRSSSQNRGIASDG